jgi:predicted nucleic acid-binding protein
VQLVIADTGPINYLILIGYIDVLPALFHKIILPAAVRDEVNEAPPSVRAWTAALPSWIEIRQIHHAQDLTMEKLVGGEEAAIALAIELHADLVLMDDRSGVKAARRLGIEVTGTLGLLSLAAKSGLLNLAESFDRIKRTNFRYRQETMDSLLAKHIPRLT